MKPTLKTLMAIALACFANAAFACSTQWNITLETFGEGVLVELRAGTPGNSRVVKSTPSTGGAVNFAALCAGDYFLAIGNDESVSVTPVRQFKDNATYSSRITVQRGSGNVSRKSRKSL